MSLFAELLAPPIVVEEADPRGMPADLSPLRPEEAAMMARAVEKRRREFTAGRVLARKAMRRLGVPEAPIVNGEDRAPRWPAEVVGSITHTKSWCAVALAPRGSVRGVGLDVEGDDDLKRNLWDTICTPADLAWLEAQPPGERGWLGKLVFSAKECAYKAQYLETEQFLGFQAMSVAIDVPGRRWRTTFNEESGGFRPGDTIEGVFRRERGLVCTACVIPAGRLAR